MKTIEEIIKSEGSITLSFRSVMYTYNDLIFNNIEEYQKFMKLSSSSKMDNIYDNSIVDTENCDLEIDTDLCTNRDGVEQFNICKND